MNLIQQDFGTSSLYKYLNIFFADKIPDDLLTYFKKMTCVKKVKSFVELNLNFKIISEFIFKPLRTDKGADVDSIVSVISTFKDIGNI